MSQPTNATSVAELAAQAMIAGVPSEIFADHCVSWHNWDEAEVPTNPAVFDGSRNALQITPDLRLDNLAVNHVGPDLSVIRYRVRGTFPDGQTMDAPGVMFIYILDGKVVRTEEYLDSAQSLKLYEAFTA